MAQIYAPNRLSAGALPRTHWGAYITPPDPLAGLGVGPPGNGKEGGEGEKEGGTGREGRASRNAQIQSWQAYVSPFWFVAVLTIDPIEYPLLSHKAVNVLLHGIFCGITFV